jgi:hypothetical protein
VDAKLSFDTEASMAKALVAMIEAYTGKQAVGATACSSSSPPPGDGIRAAERLERRRHPEQPDCFSSPCPLRKACADAGVF